MYCIRGNDKWLLRGLFEAGKRLVSRNKDNEYVSPGGAWNHPRKIAKGWNVLVIATKETGTVHIVWKLEHGSALLLNLTITI
jgi:hypothetical protein